jgi:glycosyltransferase involved in cell wall biosynthesis
MPLSVLRHFRSLGHEVHVGYYFDDAFGYTRDKCLDFREDKCLINLTDTRSPESFRRLEKIVNKKRIDLVLQIGSPFAYEQLSLLKEKMPGVKIWDWMFNPSVHYHSHFFHASVFDGIIVESEYMKKRIAEDIPDVNMVKIIPSGSPKNAAPARKKAEKSEGTLSLGYLGRLSPEKNPIGFITLAEKLSEYSNSLDFVMYGEGPQESEVLENLSRLGEQSRIRFIGYAPDQSGALENLDFLIVPSVLDGRPAVIMEANHAGVPVLATPVGAIPEMISSGENGFILHQDPAKVFSTLRPYLEEPGRLQTLKQSSLAYANKHFSIDKMLELYSSTFEEIAVQSPRGLSTVTLPLR